MIENGQVAVDQPLSLVMAGALQERLAHAVNDEGWQGIPMSCQARYEA